MCPSHVSVCVCVCVCTYSAGLVAIVVVTTMAIYTSFLQSKKAANLAMKSCREVSIGSKLGIGLEMRLLANYPCETYLCEGGY